MLGRRSSFCNLTLLYCNKYWWTNLSNFLTRAHCLSNCLLLEEIEYDLEARVANPGHIVYWPFRIPEISLHGNIRTMRFRRHQFEVTEVVWVLQVIHILDNVHGLIYTDWPQVDYRGVICLCAHIHCQESV